MKLKKSKGLTFFTDITADQIKGLLESKHVNDCFYKECKNGATWSATHLLKLDAWAMKKSYSPLSTIGYEIKVMILRTTRNGLIIYHCAINSILYVLLD
jgi:hypothetical protein